MSIRNSFVRMALGVATMLFTTSLLAEGIIGSGGGATTMAASEAHLGETGTNQTVITVDMTVTAAAYVTGAAIGNLQTLAGATRVSAPAGGSGTSGNVLSTLLMSQTAIGTIPMDVFYFSANPTGSTCTDTTAFVLANADRDKVVGIAHVSDWTIGNATATGQQIGPPIPYTLDSATSMFACVVSRGAPTFTATGFSLITKVLRQ